LGATPNPDNPNTTSLTLCVAFGCLFLKFQVLLRWGQMRFCDRGERDTIMATWLLHINS